MQNNLLAIDEIISRAKKSGAALGHGDPKVHLAYLTKIRLLPQAARKKIGNRISGCYPEYVVPLLRKIEELKSGGLTYAQIRLQLASPESAKSPMATNYSSAPTSSSPLTFLLIGLLLGFLLASNYPAGSVKIAATATLPANTNTNSLIKVVSANNSGSDPIYLIAIPNQNLYKLGTTNINLLK